MLISILSCLFKRKTKDLGKMFHVKQFIFTFARAKVTKNAELSYFR